MARVFLDTNAFIDIIEERGRAAKEELNNQDIFISPLSIHVLLYTTKQRIPYAKLTGIIDLFLLVPLSNTITNKALVGPTTDFEDNVQLHSAAAVESDVFLTADKKLLSLKFFGKMHLKFTLESKN